MEVNGEGGTVRAAVIGILISILMIVAIFKLTETGFTWTMISQADLSMLLVAFFLHFLFWFFWAVRLKLLSSFLGQRIPFVYALEATIASTFLAAITPSSAGGEPLRIKMLVDKGASVGSATAIVLAERLFDAIFFVSALPVFLLISGFSTRFGFEVCFVFLMFLVGFMLFLYFLLNKPERVDRFTDKLYSVLRRFLSEDKAEKAYRYIKNEMWKFRDAVVELTKNSINQLAIVMFLTFLIWISEFLVPSAILLGLNEDPAILLSVTSQLILVILSLIPITPGSSGIAEAGMGYLYSKFVPQHALGVLVALWRIITYYTNIVIGFIVNMKIIKNKI